MKNRFFQILLAAICVHVMLMAKTGNTGIAGKGGIHQPVNGLKNNGGIDPEQFLKKEGFNAGKQLSFIENKGQVHDQDNNARTDIQYSLRAANGLNIFIGNGEIHYQFSKDDNPDETGSIASPLMGKFQQPALQPSDTLGGVLTAAKHTFDMYRMDVELVGANKNAKIITEEKQDYYENYYLSPALSKGEGGATKNDKGEGDGLKGTTAHAYNRITYKDIYPNIDWVIYTSNGQLKHEFVVRQGGQVRDIKLKYGGATDLKLDNDGSLTATTPQGAITEQAPNTYQKDGEKVTSSFILNGDILSYTTGAYTGELIIDPTLLWATYYGGGGGGEVGYGVATDVTGNVYITGLTYSTSGIATSGAYQTTYGGGTNPDAFLAKFNSSGAIQWATYYGGGGVDQGFGVATDGSGNVFITGSTSSTSAIATSGAYQTTRSSTGQNAFLAKFNSSGAIQWATYYGGNISDYGQGVATDGSGNVYIVGYTTSTSGIATSGAYQTTYGGGTNPDAFLAKFNSSGAIQWATYYGGSSEDRGLGVATDGSGNVYIVGFTTSTSGIATSGAYQTTYGGGGNNDAFLAKFNSSGAIQWATYYGGGSGEMGYGVATDVTGNVYITGLTYSTSGIATSGAYQTTYGGGTNPDAFLAKFNSSGAIQWATYYGGSSYELGYGVATDGSGNVFITGWTYSTSAIATTGAYQTSFGGTRDAFLAKFNSSGAIQWATYYGGSNGEFGFGVATDGSGNVFITGSTSSTSAIATSGAYQTTLGSSQNAFLAKFQFVAPIVGTAAVCIGSTTTLSDATTGGTWSSGSTAVATVGTTGVVTGVTSGTATISYSVSGSTPTITVTVNPLPASITGTTNVCAGLTTALTDATTGGTWSSSNTSNATVGSGTGVVTGVSAGTVTISYTLPTGCITTTSVTVNPLPASITGTANVCAGLTTLLTDATTGGSWSSGNTSLATVGSGTGVVMGVSIGSASITYKLSTGCIMTTPVTVNPLPAAITGTANVCVGLTTALTDASTGGTWSSSNTSLAAVGSTGVVTGVSAGTTTITYMLSTGCIMTTPVTVNPLPAAITGTANVCAGLTTALTDASTGGTWSSSNTSFATVSGIGIVSGVSAGIPGITYKLSTGCIITTPVTVNPLPAAITGTANVCVGLTTTLTDATTGGTWSSSNTSLATVGGTGIVTGVSAGNPNITYTLSTGCIMITPVTVNPLPAVITGTTNVCAGLTTALTDATTGGTWSSSNTSLATIGGTGIVTGVMAGNSNITYTLSTGCIMTTPVTVNPLPAGITGTANVCVGLTTALTDATTGGTWSSGNTSLATVISGTGIVTGVSTGTPAITYKLSTGCMITTTVTVNPLPAAITGTKTVCAGLTTTLTDATTGGTWSSSNTGLATVGGTGVVTGVSGGNPQITYTLSTGCIMTTPVTVNPISAITGTANVCAGLTTALTDAATGGTWSSSNTTLATVSGTGIVTGVLAGTPVITYKLSTGCIMTTPVTVNPLPSGISGTKIVCAGLTTNLSDAGGGTWSSSNISLATVDISGMVTGVAAGVPKITYTLSTGCIITTPVTVNPSPAAITGTANVCAGLTTALTDVTTGGTWSSSNTSVATVSGTGVVAGLTAGTPLITYSMPTGCIMTMPVTVNPLPGAISGIANVCAGLTTTLSDAGGGAWSSSNISLATVDISGMVTGISAGTPKITYTMSTGCITTIPITVNPLPAGVSGTKVVCEGLTTNLSDVTTGGKWSSSNTSLATIGSGTGVVTGVAAGSPDITYTLSTGCVATTPVTVNPLPLVYTVTGGGYYCAGDTGVHITLSGSTSGNKYQLYYGGIAIGTAISGTGLLLDFGLHTAAGTYKVVAKDAITACTNNMFDSATITINPVPLAITGFANVCAGLTTNLSDATTAGTWSCSNTALATVGSTGVVTGAVAGAPTITYTLSTGCMATTPVTVNPLPTAITGTTNVCAGSTTALTDATISGTWGSSNTSLATVGAGTGIVSGVSAGNPNITYTLSTGCITTIPVTVNPLPATITGTANVCAGLTTTLSDGTAGGTWSSGSTAIATVGSTTGTVNGVTAGTSVITYTLVTGCAANNVITVNPLPSAIAGTTHVCVNATTGLSDLSGSGAWSAGNTTIATVVAATGVVTGVSSGTSAITYTLPTGCITNTTVTVNPLPYAGTITGATFVCPDSTITLSDAITGGIWSSNNNNANVTNAGVVTGVATGTDTIIYSVTNVCGTDNAKWALNIIKCDFTIVHAIANPLSELKVYPNPNEGMFTIKLMSESNEQVSIVITNLLEQKVKEITTVTNQPVNIKLDVAAGVYLISANTEHGKYVGKVTIQ